MPPDPELTPDEPFPGYRFDLAASKRADALQAAARAVILELSGETLFDTEPELLHKTLARLGAEHAR